MRAEYKRNVNSAHLILEEKRPYREDYQMRMLKENDITGLLKVKGRGINEYSRYYYDIGGKVSIKAMYEKASINSHDLKLLLEQLAETAKDVYNYMLNTNYLILDPHYIFYDNGTFFFCYFPYGGKTLCKELHHLAEYIVGQVDYEDKESIYIAYEFHKRTMEDNYNIDQLISFLFETEEQAEEQEQMVEEELWESEADAEMMIEEAMPQKWNPVKHIFSRNKKKKWGEWKNII